MHALQGAALVAATLAMGLMAGVFWLYAHTIMPGLARTDDRTFVGAFQSIDRAIINPWFLPAFFGALVLTGLAAVINVADEGGAVLPWTVAAFLLYLAVVLITFRVHLPRNDAIKATEDPDSAALRRRFDEATWMRWNTVRALASTAALGCLAWALAEYTP
jgi:uncharacterized membrane protein